MINFTPTKQKSKVNFTPNPTQPTTATGMINYATKVAQQPIKQFEAKYPQTVGLTPSQKTEFKNALVYTKGDATKALEAVTTPTGLSRIGASIKENVLKGAEGVQKVVSAVKGETSDLEGFRQFYGMKTPEQIDIKQLSPQERAKMGGTGLVNFSTGALSAAMTPIGGVVEEIPVVGKPIGEAFGAIQEQGGKTLVSEPVIWAAKKFGVDLSPEDIKTIEEGGSTVAGFYMTKIAEDSLKMEKSAGLSKSIQDAMRNGDIATVKKLIPQYEASIVKPTIAGTIGQAVSNVGKTFMEGAGTLLEKGQPGTMPVPEAFPAVPPSSGIASKIGEKFISSTSKIDPSKTVEFQKMTKKLPGEWLQERGIIAPRAETAAQLVDYWQTSKKAVDTALAKIEGRFYDKSVERVLQDQIDYFQKTADRPNLSLARRRLETLQGEGLTLSEMNSVKRLYESTEKLGYLKEKNAVGVARATNFDDAIREYIISKAEERGFGNLRELNKETQAAKFLADEIYKKMGKQEANNVLGLTDQIMALGGAVDPKAWVALGLKKIVFGETGKSIIARLLSPESTKGIPEVPTRRIELKSKQAKLQSGVQPIAEAKPIAKPNMTKPNIPINKSYPDSPKKATTLKDILDRTKKAQATLTEAPTTSIEKAKADIAEAKRLMEKAPDASTSEFSMDVYTKQDYAKYIKGVQEWIDRKTNKLTEAPKKSSIEGVNNKGMDLITEAKKYKSADEFVKNYTDKFYDLGKQVNEILSKAKRDKTGKIIDPAGVIDKQLKELGVKSGELPDFTKLTEIWNKANKNIPPTRAIFIETAKGKYNQVFDFGDYKISVTGWKEKPWEIVKDSDFNVTKERSYKPIASFKTREELWDYIKKQSK